MTARVAMIGLCVWSLHGGCGARRVAVEGGEPAPGAPSTPVGVPPAAGCSGPGCGTSGPEGASSWLETIGGAGYSAATAVAVSDDGAVVAVGYFEGALSIGGETVRARGQTDLFAVRFTPEGVVDWLVGGGHSGGDRARDVALDRDGNAYVVGETGGHHFSGLTVLGTHSIKPSARDAFVARIDRSGEVRWLRGLGGWGTDAAHGVAVDAAGAVWVGGYFAGNTGGGPGAEASFGDVTLASRGSLDGFLVKLDAAGSVTHVQQVGGGGADRVADVVAVDGGACLAGELGERSEIDGAGAVQGDSDALVACFDRDAAPRWARSLSGPEADRARGLAAAGGALYVTGDFQRRLEPGLTALGHRNAFAASYDLRSGDRRWLAGPADSDGATGVALAAGPAGVIYWLGEISGPAHFGELAAAHEASRDIFLAALRDGAAPQFEEVWTFAGGSADIPGGIAVSGDILVLSGSWYDDLQLDDQVIRSANLEDAFIWRTSIAAIKLR